MSVTNGIKLGMIGLGKMGRAMAKNIMNNGYKLKTYDIDKSSLQYVSKLGAEIYKSPHQLANDVDILFSVLPNDKILNKVIMCKNNGILKNLKPNSVHVCCSTISPYTSLKISKIHEEWDHNFVSAPIFARPDGLENGQATFMLSGHEDSMKIIKPILETTSTGIYDFGTDPSAATVAKLCGNFLIASSIESMAESFVLAEKHGVDRIKLHEMLTSTIFDCLIYKGYGQRVSEYDHFPYENAHFSLDLGVKDINLVKSIAKESNVHMPFLDILQSKFITSQNKDRGHLDWSAIALESKD